MPVQQKSNGEMQIQIQITDYKIQAAAGGRRPAGGWRRAAGGGHANTNTKYKDRHNTKYKLQIQIHTHVYFPITYAIFNSI